MDRHCHFLPAVFVIGLTAFATPTYAQTTDELLNAGRDDNDWILPGKTYQDNRYTGLEQITPKNVQMLAKAWSTAALALELRSTITQARLLGEGGQRDQGHHDLAHVYGRFTEGFETADLRTARELMENLA